MQIERDASLVGITLSNTPITGRLISSNAQEILQAFALAGFLYAILRHRVVDHTVVFSRTLVYAMTTSEETLGAARAEIEASAVRLDQARAQAQASEERAQASKASLDEARTHNETLLELLRARGAVAKS